MRINTAKTCMFCMCFGLTIVIIQILFLGTTFAQVSIQKADSLWKKTGGAEFEYIYNRFGFATAITDYSFLSVELTQADLRRIGIEKSDPRKNYEVVIGQASRNEYGMYEGSIDTLIAEAFLVRDGKLVKPLWNFGKKATGGALKQVVGVSFYQTYYSWHSESGPLYSFNDLSSGDEIFKYTSNLLSVSIPNTPQVRLVAYMHIVPYKQDLIGTLLYNSPDSTMHELNIYRTKPGLSYFAGKVEFSDLVNRIDKLTSDNQHLILSSSISIEDPKGLSGFSVKLKFYDAEVRLPIPIKNDDFDLSNFTSDVIRIKRIK